MAAFISYHHGDADEEQLAQELKTALEQRGLDVFIDTSLLVGADWVAEIDRHLSSCEQFIILLSKAAMESEMVQGEIRKAARRRQSGGKPLILPVRLRYFGPLDYELESHLQRLQYARWESPADSPRVVADILGAVRGQPLPQGGHPSGPYEPDEGARRPLPRVDPRTLSAPGGTLASDDPVYVERSADKVALDLASFTGGSTFVIKAPRQMGKSSLLIRYLSAAIARKKAAAFIDLSFLTRDDLASYPTFLMRLASELHRSLSLDRSMAPNIANQQDLTWFVEDIVRGAIKGPLVLAFDEVDRILGRPFQADFFTMLRLWHNNRSNPLLSAWRSVDLALVISTEPYLLIPEADRSPFNVGRTVSLEGFALDQCQALNAAYGALLSTSEVDALWKLLSGHPYLMRLAFYRLTSPDPVSYDELMRSAAHERGPFGDHLRAMLSRLHGKPDLIDGLRQVLTRGTTANDDVYSRLYGAGLVKKTDGRLEPANAVYAQFFKSVL